MAYPGMPVFYDFSNHQFAPINPTHYPGLIGHELYESDEFRMYSFKIKKCPRTRSHDWTLCPFAHRGEKAKRRDPIRYTYAPVPCPDYRDGQGICVKGHNCPFAHGVFEYWLHPAKYRTCECSTFPLCQRKVCFFAHTPEELRDESEAQKLYMLRLMINGKEENMNIPAIPNGSTSHEVVPEATIVATNNNVGNEETKYDFLESLNGFTICDKDEGSRGIFGKYNIHDLVPKTTKVATNSNVGNERTADFLASLSGLTIYEKDETSIEFFGKNNIDWLAKLLN